jgi:hypothetical protein
MPPDKRDAARAAARKSILDRRSQQVDGGRKMFLTHPAPYPRALSPGDFFGGPGELLGLTWEGCRTVWQTTPA